MRMNNSSLSHVLVDEKSDLYQEVKGAIELLTETIKNQLEKEGGSMPFSTKDVENFLKEHPEISDARKSAILKRGSRSE